jgi:2-phosphoglycerate kinase
MKWGSKIHVINQHEDSEVPFLLGIMTRSLQNAGMAFEEAYQLASKIRDELGPNTEVTTEALSERVEEYLKQQKMTEVLKRYTGKQRRGRSILIRDRQGQLQPFSKGRLSQTLEICALPAERCYSLVAHLERALLREGRSEIESTELAVRMYHYLREREGKEVAHRYRVWVEFSRSGRPLVILVGGTTGSGKSTISAEVAHRLNIVRTQSTDMLREVMRLMLPARLLPTLHTSTFNAWQALPSREDFPVSFESHLEDGYLAQAEQVAVGIEGVLHRAERERISIILEGVHVHPQLQKRLMNETDAVVVPLLLAVLRKKKLRTHLTGRGQQVSSRRSKRYLTNFDAIWQLQTFLLSEADRHGIPIISNGEEGETMTAVMGTISDALARAFSPDGDSVFSKMLAEAKKA